MHNLVSTTKRVPSRVCRIYSSLHLSMPSGRVGQKRAASSNAAGTIRSLNSACLCYNTTPATGPESASPPYRLQEGAARDRAFPMPSPGDERSLIPLPKRRPRQIRWRSSSPSIALAASPGVAGTSTFAPSRGTAIIGLVNMGQTVLWRNNGNAETRMLPM